MNQLKEKYNKEIISLMKEKFNFKSVMQASKLQKIVINMGIGDASRNKAALEAAVEELALISGQKPILTKAKKAEANFKIREQMVVGCKVTLRNYLMYNFLSKLINFILPQTRDFRGLKRNSFDNFGNYTFGIKEQIIFPEIKYEKIKRIQGMDVTLVFSSDDEKQNLFLLEQLGLIFYNPERII